MSDWPAAADRPVILTIARPADAAQGSAVFGGWIMGQFDHAAGRAGRAVADACLIRAIQEMGFHAPLSTGSDFAVYAREIGRGRTSFTLELAGFADPDGDRTLIASARFIMVAIDAAGKPRALAT